VDDDGWPDILLACDSTPSLLLMNNHDGTFRDEGLLRGVALNGEGKEVAGMGVGVGDYDLDGRLNVVKTHFQKQATVLYHNSGKGEFEDVTSQAGPATERRFISWGTCMLDLDNDGFPDIFVVTGTVYPELEPAYAQYPRQGPRLVFRNWGNGKFAGLGEEDGSGISACHVGRGCAFGDCDNDGDMDMVITNQNEPPSLLRNDARPSIHWLKVRLEGTNSNRSAIGGRVIVRYGGKMQAQEVMRQSSYVSANDPRLHFGLGAQKTADIEARWPLGTTDNFKNVAAGQLITIREDSDSAKASIRLESWSRP
jgi:enediyne biosynthesis protein E4